MVQWLFSKLPPDGSRSGGDPAAHAFEHSVESFVREVIQNANDQALDGGAEVVFRFRDMSGGALADFCDALDWCDGLRPHLDAVAATEKGRAIEDTLRRLDQDGRLLVLTIEDRGTIGLTGEEVEDDSHFCALCRDKLFSHKQDPSAGGSYGLGKSVLWTISGLATVLFLSRLHEDPSQRQSPRLIGRCELPYHRLERPQQESFAGPGWFGELRDVAGGQRADSVWGDRAEAISEQISLHHAERSGTSIMVLGFRDPESDEDVGAEAFVRRIASSAVENFWPVLSREHDFLRVFVEGPQGQMAVEVHDSDELRPLARCYEERHRAGESLERMGDVARRDIAIKLPGRRDGTPAVTGWVTLLVRLAAERDDDSWEGRVALFRGPGMVVKYWDQRRLAIGSRPFHALLVCGTARDFDEGANEDQAVEEFLRYAEPPGHDKWDSTAKLKDRYKQGYKKAIDDMKGRVRQALHDLVVPQPAEGERGPDRLRRRFPLGAPSDISPGRGESPFQFEDLTGWFEAGKWELQGAIEASTSDHDGWKARVEIVQVREDNRPLANAPVPLHEVAIDTAGVTVELEDGKAMLRAEPGVQRVDFIGWSSPVFGDRSRRFAPGEVELRVTGELFAVEGM